MTSLVALIALLTVARLLGTFAGWSLENWATVVSTPVALAVTCALTLALAFIVTAFASQIGLIL